MTKPFRLAVLGNPDGWYVRDLQRAAHERGRTSIEVLSFVDLSVTGTSDRHLKISSKQISPSSPAGQGRPGKQEPADPIRIVASDAQANYDALLVRTMPLGTLEQVVFRMNALHVAEQLGVQIVNPPRTLEISIDKWLTLDFIRRADLTIPGTTVCQTRDAAMEAFEAWGGNVVVKPLFGGEGRGIVRVDHPDMAWRVFSTLEQLGAVIYVQEFLPHHGFDLRLLVIGREIYCVARHAPNGDWRTNLSKGGLAVAHEPTSAQVEIARRAAEAVGGRIIGVDILPTTDGRDVVLEVNAVPGWRGTAKALGVDIAMKVLDELR